MLTKELLRFNRRRDGRILPRFIDTKSRDYLNLAEELITIYSQSIGLGHDEINEIIQPVMDASRSSLIAKGINKLLLDRCEFLEPDPKLEEIRWATFKEAAQLLSAPIVGHLETFREGVAQAMGMTTDTLTTTLFSDLANRQTLQSFRPLKGQQVLHRYNMALAQGLLLGTTHLELEIVSPDVGRLRQFFRQLKFFRLLATICPLAPDHYHIILDGPLSLFDMVRKYGLQFASILPAVCHLEKWSLKAEVRPAGQGAGQLLLDQDSGLVSHYSASSSYVPPEFARFATQFTTEATDWTILPEVHPLHLEANDLIVADFTFRHISKLTVHMELFHRWHKAPLLRRLSQLETSKKRKSTPNLVVAVDRSLAKNPEITEKLQESPYFQKFGLPFNEFPSVKRVVKTLESFLP
ncbi:MAG: DUF790 family protein [Magnetococcales bacterium]|nr:DUF790 family protein [Magnetococcales bacterium]